MQMSVTTPYIPIGGFFAPVKKIYSGVKTNKTLIPKYFSNSRIDCLSIFCSSVFHKERKLSYELL